CGALVAGRIRRRSRRMQEESNVRRRVESRRAAHGRVLPAFGYRFEPAASARPRGIRSLWRRRAPTTRKPAPTVRAHRGRAFVRWGPATDAGGRQLTNLIESGYV